jgi:hypothetical protein
MPEGQFSQSGLFRVFGAFGEHSIQLSADWLQRKHYYEQF